jgi:hypothetical protein
VLRRPSELAIYLWTKRGYFSGCPHAPVSSHLRRVNRDHAALPANLFKLAILMSQVVRESFLEASSPRRTRLRTFHGEIPRSPAAVLVGTSKGAGANGGSGNETTADFFLDMENKNNPRVMLVDCSFFEGLLLPTCVGFDFTHSRDRQAILKPVI